MGHDFRVWVEKSVLQHKCRAPLKELHWVDGGLHSAERRTMASRWAQDTNQYLGHFRLNEERRAALAAHEATLIDATPSYIDSYPAAARAAALIPHARLVVVLRVRPY